MKSSIKRYSVGLEEFFGGAGEPVEAEDNKKPLLKEGFYSLS